MEKHYFIDNFLFRNKVTLFVRRLFLFIVIVNLPLSFFAQNQSFIVSGKVRDTSGEALIGVNVTIEGAKVGTITDINGAYSIKTATKKQPLIFSYIGFESVRKIAPDNNILNIVMTEESKALKELVIVGYGVQKKASIVGSIATTTDKELKRTGGVTNLGQALVGNISGLTAIQTNNQPGKSDPKILIRGSSSWNNTDPYILVDGVERRMNDIDMNEVDNISVLKDASATAVFGVKGANGVILITTKRGSAGKSVFNISANSTMKVPSRLMDKLDAYDSFMLKDAAIERELVINPASWSDYQPLEIAQRYRNPGNYLNLKYPEAYPNVDWQDYMLKDYTMDTHINMNASGGNNIVKYFASLAYLNEGDILNIPSYKGYQGGFSYNRFNFRSNLDINVTKTTVVTLNLAGYYGKMQSYNNTDWNAEGFVLAGLYTTPPDMYIPQYADGNFGATNRVDQAFFNPYAFAVAGGYEHTNTTNVTSDISLKQDLKEITKGLNATVRFSFDNNYQSVNGLSQSGGTPTKYINPAIEDALPGTESQYITIAPANGVNQFTWVQGPNVLYVERPNLSSLKRRLSYQAQINYARQFGKHDVAATGVFNRENYAAGSEFPRLQENWVFRATYNYDSRYFAEVNGAYNGSEKFAPKYRFGFFPSMGLGWTLKNESFLKDVSWLDRLRIRYNYGFIGDDNISSRWLYSSQYNYGGKIPLSGKVDQLSPYTIYSETQVGNSEVHWEKAKKINYGLDVAILNSLISLSFDYFTENRTNILLVGTQRTFPAYYNPVSAPTANVGSVDKKGFEIELQFKKNLNKNLFVWANMNITHVVDRIKFKEEAMLKDSYLLAAGYSMNQTKSLISDGILKSWDDVYASPTFASNDQNKMPGDFRVLDFNANGLVESDKDIAANGYTNIPQNTYSTSVGFEYKGLSAMVQFYAVNNITRNTSKPYFNLNSNLAYAQAQDFWSTDNPDGAAYLPRWKATGSTSADFNNSDGSYIRLKNAEIAYTLSGKGLKTLGLSSLRIYLNGNNLIFWSKLPDDREYGNDGNFYPTTKRINLGLDFKF